MLAKKLALSAVWIEMVVDAEVHIQAYFLEVGFVRLMMWFDCGCNMICGFVLKHQCFFYGE